MAELPEEATEPAPPSITITWGARGLEYDMHNMNGVILYAIVGVLTHEAERLLFQADVATAQENARKSGKGKLVTLTGRPS